MIGQRNWLHEVLNGKLSVALVHQTRHFRPELGSLAYGGCIGYVKQ